MRCCEKVGSISQAVKHAISQARKLFFAMTVSSNLISNDIGRQKYLQDTDCHT